MLMTQNNMQSQWQHCLRVIRDTAEFTFIRWMLRYRLEDSSSGACNDAPLNRYTWPWTSEHPNWLQMGEGPFNTALVWVIRARLLASVCKAPSKCVTEGLHVVVIVWHCLSYWTCPIAKKNASVMQKQLHDRWYIYYLFWYLTWSTCCRYRGIICELEIGYSHFLIDYDNCIVKVRVYYLLNLTFLKMFLCHWYYRFQPGMFRWPVCPEQWCAMRLMVGEALTLSELDLEIYKPKRETYSPFHRQQLTYQFFISPFIHIHTVNNAYFISSQKFSVDILYFFA